MNSQWQCKAPIEPHQGGGGRARPDCGRDAAGGGVARGTFRTAPWLPVPTLHARHRAAAAGAGRAVDATRRLAGLSAGRPSGPGVARRQSDRRRLGLGAWELGAGRTSRHPAKGRRLKFEQSGAFLLIYAVLILFCMCSALDNQVELEILENKRCIEWYHSQGKKTKILPSQMCAGYENGGKDSCWVS